MMTRFVRSAIVAITTFIAATAAYAAPIIGGDTYFKLDIGSAFTSAGGVVTPVGTASYLGDFGGEPVYLLPITGGSTTPPVVVEHFGSGLSFTFGANTLTLGNFVVDGSALTIAGDGSFNGTSFTNQTLFSVSAVNDPNFPLLLSTTATSAAAFKSLIGVDVPVSVGIASAAVLNIRTAVPEPATWLMMIGGFGLVGAALRRRTTSSIVFS